jgi:hypothetical protein
VIAFGERYSKGITSAARFAICQLLQGGQIFFKLKIPLIKSKKEPLWSHDCYAA